VVLTEVAQAPESTPSESEAVPPPRRLPTWQFRSASLLLYFALTCWLYGVDFFNNTRIINAAGADMVQEVWFLAWPAYAVAHGQSIFYTTAMNYPHGVNLLANTSMPLLGILAMPITWIFGPVVTYTLLMRLGFILSAAAAQFVARRIGLSRPASIAAGLLYGFSTIQIVQGWGHLFLVFAPLPPLVLYSVYCLMIGRWSPVRAGCTAGGLLALDFLISAERALITLVVLAVILIVAAVFRWRAITVRLARDVAIATGCAAVVAILIVAVPIHEMLGRGHVSGVAHSWIQSYQTQLASFIFPDVFTWLDPFHMKLNILHASSQWENGSYIGIPLLLTLIVAAVRGWRHRLVRVGAVATLLVMGMSLGEVLKIDGHKTILTVHHHHITLDSPYKLLTHIPFIENIEPIRLMYLAWLGVALLGGFALDRLLRWQRRTHVVGAHSPAPAPRSGPTLLTTGRGLAVCVLVAIVVLSLLPDRPYRMPSTAVASWLTSSQMESTIPAGSVVLFYPYPTLIDNHAMLDQAVGNFHYRIIGGEGLYGNAQGVNVGIQALGPSSLDLPSVFIRSEVDNSKKLLAGLPFTLPPIPPNDAATVVQFREFVSDNDVSTIVMETATTPQAVAVQPYLDAAFGRPKSHDEGSLLVWSVFPNFKTQTTITNQ
jgi:hypothetical protein